ncbi:hypothetical protein NX059_002171 [Plenodomus lindquistii]|nr:hypothetical protein NX059_002171 [Plenodomus lindquistii]
MSRFAILLLFLFASLTAGYTSRSLGADKSHLWPRDQASGITTIPFCFSNHHAMGLRHPVEQGWLKWHNKIGLPGRSNGHSLEFKRYETPSQPGYPFCRGAGDRWNPAVPNHVVEVSLGAPGIGCDSSLGYNEHGAPGRHFLIIDTANEHMVNYFVTHELGHIFGLMHEHSRADRDNHIVYNCDALIDFATKWAAARAAGVSKFDFCNDPDVADRFDFVAFGFHKDNGLYSAEYDHDSIMHYSSYTGARNDLIRADRNNMDHYPLTKLVNGVRSIIPSRWRGEVKVSDGDGEGIRKLYPWG